MIVRSLRRSLALAAAVLVALAGCQPSVPLLTDPRAIVEAAVTTTAAASTVRLDLGVEGELVIDPLGTGAGAPIALRGTTATADIDLAGGDARVTFSSPGVLGLAGELISLDGTTYLKTSLTGPQYQVIGTDGAAPGAPPDRTTMLAALLEVLGRPELAPEKGEDVPCGTGTCYTIAVAVSPAELVSLGLGDVPLPSGLPIPLPDLTAAAIDVTLRIDQSTTRLAGLTAELDLADAGALTVEATFTKWDEAVSIAAPSPEEIAAGG